MRALAILAVLVATAAFVMSVVLYVRLQDARIDRAALTTQTDRKLCGEVEGLKGAIRSVLRQSPASKGRAVALRKFAPHDCRKLPTATPLPH